MWALHGETVRGEVILVKLSSLPSARLESCHESGTGSQVGQGGLGGERERERERESVCV
jgi:hypothetical protein